QVDMHAAVDQLANGYRVDPAATGQYAERSDVVCDACGHEGIQTAEHEVSIIERSAPGAASKWWADQMAGFSDWAGRHPFLAAGATVVGSPIIATGTVGALAVDKVYHLLELAAPVATVAAHAIAAPFPSGANVGEPNPNVGGYVDGDGAFRYPDGSRPGYGMG